MSLTIIPARCQADGKGLVLTQPIHGPLHAQLAQLSICRCLQQKRGLGGCRYVRKLRLQGCAPPTLLAIAPGPGMLVVHSWADLGLHVFNINSEHLVSCAGNERLSALAVTASGHFLLTGGLRGVVSLQWLHSLEVPHISDLSQFRVSPTELFTPDLLIQAW